MSDHAASNVTIGLLVAVLGLLIYVSWQLQQRKPIKSTSSVQLEKVTGITLSLVPLVYIVVCAVLFVPGYSEQLRTVVVTAILSGLLGAIYGYWLDSSAKEAKKDSPDAPGATTTTTISGVAPEVPPIPPVPAVKESP